MLSKYPWTFSPWRIRKTEIRNRVVFPPTCPTWVDGAGVLTDMATEYYRERARGGVGLIIIGATHVHADSLAAPLLTPQLFNDDNVEPLARVAEAVHAEGSRLAIQLWHSGVRGLPFPKQDPAAPRDASWYTLSPSQVPLGEFPGGSTPKAMTEEEILDLIDAYATAARRAVARRPRRGGVPPEPRLPAVAIPLAALQQADGQVGGARARGGCGSRSRR